MAGAPEGGEAAGGIGEFAGVEIGGLGGEAHAGEEDAVLVPALDHVLVEGAVLPGVAEDLDHGGIGEGETVEGKERVELRALDVLNVVPGLGGLENAVRLGLAEGGGRGGGI